MYAGSGMAGCSFLGLNTMMNLPNVIANGGLSAASSGAAAQVVKDPTWVQQQIALNIGWLFSHIPHFLWVPVE